MAAGFVAIVGVLSQKTSAVLPAGKSLPAPGISVLIVVRLPARRKEGIGRPFCRFPRPDQTP